MLSPKEIMEHYIINPEDSFFVNGVPPIENVAVVAYDPLWPEIYSSLASTIKNKLGSNLLRKVRISRSFLPKLTR